jgi:hypothetical protein
MDNLANRAPYEDGNRLAVQGAGGAHFFYHVDRPAFASQEGERIVRSVQAFVDGYPLTSAQVVVLHSSDFEVEGEIHPFLPLGLALGLTDAEIESGKAVLCQWSALHDDGPFAGSSFLSIVLHTGPNPYIMQTAYTSYISRPKNRHIFNTNTTDHMLSVGDTFVFDPTTPHMAFPKYLHQDQLLVLLQFEISDKDDVERAMLLERFPVKKRMGANEYPFRPAPDDAYSENQQSVI